jgi:3',5'-cyclic AMP phosphodiesterase CpdA
LALFLFKRRKAMKIFPGPDFHTESEWKLLDKYRGDADVIVIPGDFHTKTDGPSELRRIFGDREILYLPGNHEYYGSVMVEEDDRLRKACKNQGIHFLQCDHVEIDGIHFVGNTFWTDFKLFGEEKEVEARFQVSQYLNDYRAIRFKAGDYRPISTLQTLEIHKRHKAWLIEQFEVYRGKPLVVITHHCPSKRCVHPDYKEDLASAGFASDLDDLVIQSGAKYWLCGHSHVAQHFRLGGTQVWMNPRGYAHEKIEGFNAWLTLEIDKDDEPVRMWPRVRDLPEEERKPFTKRLRGQTRPMIEGISMDDQDAFYPWDYQDWKDGFPVLD